MTAPTATKEPTHPEIKLIRTQYGEPVPSDKGPSVGVEWSLSINGVEIMREHLTTPWIYDPVHRSNFATQAPERMVSKYYALRKAFKLPVTNPPSPVKTEPSSTQPSTQPISNPPVATTYE